MGDWNLPTLTDPYANFLDSLKSRDLDAISLGAFFVPQPIVGMMRYDRPNNFFQEFVAPGQWQTKVLSVAGGGTGSATPGGAVGNLGLGTMAVQNANNVNITGGSLISLNALTVAGTPYFGDSLTVQNNINTGGVIDINGMATFRGGASVPSAAGLVVSYDVAVGRTLYTSFLNVSANASVTGTVTAQGAIFSGGLDVAGRITGNSIEGAQLVAANAIFNRGGYLSGPGDRAITNGADGTIIAGAIGYGYTGAGTRVLVDNNTWVDQNLIGGGVREVVHNNMSFSTDELVKDIVIPWAIMPISVKNWHLQFDQPYSDNSSTNGGPIFYSVIYLGPNQARITRTIGPGAVQPILATTVVYTAFHHRTEVN